MAIFENPNFEYLATKRCLLDLLHFFVGFSILSLVEVYGIYKKSFGDNEKSSQNECIDKWITLLIIIIIFVIFSMAFSIFNIGFNFETKFVSKFEARLYAFIMCPIYTLLFIVMIILWLCVCCTPKLVVTTFLISIQAVLYYSHFVSTQKKLLSQNLLPPPSGENSVNLRCPTPTPPPPPPSYMNACTSINRPLLSSSSSRPPPHSSADDNDYYGDNDSD